MSLIKVKSRGTDNVTGRKNIVMNGDMRIAQRGTAAVTTSGSFTVDRWKNISNASDFSAVQSTTVPSGQGFYKSIHISPTSTKSPGSGTYFFTSHYVEGLNMGHLDWGNSGAKTVTVSFWVRSSKTGIYSMGMKNAGATRSRQQEYTISAANTWEKKTITVTGETSGSWPVDNTRGIAIDFCLAGASSAVSTIGSWISANSNMTTNQVNFFDSTSNNFYLTGVQLEVGNSASDFEHRSFVEELDLCHRYFYNGITANGTGTYGAFPINFRNFVSTGNNGHIVFTIALPKPMRTIPTFTHDLANSNHAGSGTGANADNWQFYHQNQGWGSYAGNGNMNTLSRQGSSDSQVQIGTYYISPNANSYDQLTIGSNRKFHFSAEL